jgi:hypothetical protein
MRRGLALEIRRIDSQGILISPSGSFTPPWSPWTKFNPGSQGIHAWASRIDASSSTNRASTAGAANSLGSLTSFPEDCMRFRLHTSPALGFVPATSMRASGTR